MAMKRKLAPFKFAVNGSICLPVQLSTQYQRGAN